MKASLEAAERQFEAAASSATLHCLPREKDVDGGVVTAEEMSGLYGSQFARKHARGRTIYDQLIALAEHGLCPLCGQRPVSTLDHHLPKSIFPSLAIAILNLIPACADCNKTKRDHAPLKAAEQTLHPYFDDFSKDRWLHAKVVETDPPSLTFFVNAPVHWSDLSRMRAEHHLQTFALAKLFATQAAQELSNIRDFVSKLYDRAGSAAVRDHLVEQAASREAAYRNSWQTAMYASLAASHWYCSGGFRAPSRSQS